MTLRCNRTSASVKPFSHESGQAVAECAVLASLLILFVLAAIDFGRALHYMQVMVSISRQGSNLASRGDSLATSATAVLNGDAPLDLSRYGEVIVTAVTNTNGVNTITGQVAQGGLSSLSKIGTVIGAVANVPAEAAALLQPGQTIYVTEVFYSYQPITPIGNFLTNTVLPSALYEVAYF